VFQGVPPLVAGKGIFSIGHQGNLCGFYGQHKVYKLLRARVAFNIQFRGHHIFQLLRVGIAYMPFIGPGVYRYAIGAKFFAINGCFYHIGHIAAPCIAQGGKLVYVHA
jgi:hypothetical protein